MAAKRMNLLTENETYTIHKYLGYDGKSWSFNEFNKCKTDVIIIDETSMLNQEIFYRLLSAIEYNTKLVFVGDVDQLPAVGPGNVLRELINSNLISTIFLTKIFRQGKYTNIILEAKKIKEGETDTNLFSTSFESELVYLREKKLDFINEIIIKIILDLKEKAKEKNISFQLITPRNDGPLSIKTLNKLLQEILNPPSEDKKELNLGYEILRVGDRVVVKKNNYQLNIFNGDIGKIIDITKDTLSIFIENKYEKSVVNIPIEIVDETLKLAYALTVHKCQGSEYDIVLLILVKEHGKLLLQRNLLYTALTRAKKKFILIGSQEAFKDAILNDKIQKRNTLLAERIQKWKENPNVSTLSLLSQYYKNNINELIGKENE
jgi:exodeoxyribonuclease V alpha subunit